MSQGMWQRKQGRPEWVNRQPSAKPFCDVHSLVIIEGAAHFTRSNSPARSRAICLIG